MGIYSEYLVRQWDLESLTAARKEQLREISRLRGGRDILVYAADLGKSNAPILIDQRDLLPVHDQLSNLRGTAIDVILQTSGGSGEVAEEIVRLLRGKYSDVAFIIPGWAKSAGTIMTMAGDEILMGPTSALGPIDAQLFWQGKVFSAEALLEGFRKIQKEVEETGALSRAYIPILQGISPGELQSAQNALDFARILVRDWLTEYKFKDWHTHSSTGAPVTEEERRQRAFEVADQLCSHSKWLSHGRSIRIDDLRAMRLKITDFTETAELSEAIQRYYALLQMTFESNIYKLFETLDSQIYRYIVEHNAMQKPKGAQAKAMLSVRCQKCGTEAQVQANLGVAQPLEPGKSPFPADNKFKCTICGAETDLSNIRQQLEAQTQQPVVAQ